MQTASAYQMKDRWLIHSMRRTTAGLLVSCEPFVCLPLEAEVQVLGETLITALRRAVGVVQHPTDWKPLALPRLAVAGVKSERAFQLQSLLVSVTTIADVILLLPTRNGGTSGNGKGFHTLEDQGIEVLANAASERLGAALNQAVNKCLR